MFSTKDLLRIKAKGIPFEKVERQLQFFRDGFPFPIVTAPAVPGSGIVCLSKEEEQQYKQLYESWGGSRIKFVPASGAASRMFKSLFAAIELWRKDPSLPTEPAIGDFFANLDRFAFYPRLSALNGFEGAERLKILELLLEKDGLNYGAMPKGLLDFHKYSSFSRTPFEEHLLEAGRYACAPDRSAKLHFTVSPEHRNAFEALWNSKSDEIERETGIKYNVDFSIQQSSTDTIAVDENNNPFRDEKGDIVFRPGGHGALLANLQMLTQDLIFVKNIDNVVAEQYIEPTVHWKKVLAGLLLNLRSSITSYLNMLETGSNPLQYNAIARFLTNTFCIEHPAMPSSEFGPYLYDRLNRPLRVCGMVRNTGEPGGGPFIVRDKDGSSSLQILESAQFDVNDKASMEIFRSATHFNPVDMVCCTKNYKGGFFNLDNYSDPNTGFISSKSYQGRVLKAQELPGLWNGAMSRWNTVFVEVPADTFNPVKTVNDLLKKHHLVY